MAKQPKKQKPKPVATWRKLWDELVAMRGQGGVKAYARGKKAVQVFNDPEFRGDHPRLSETKLKQLITETLEDLCLNFDEIRALLEYRPKRADWADGKLRTMYEQVRKEINAAKPVQKPPRRNISQSQYEEATDKIATLTEQVQTLTREKTNAEQLVAEKDKRLAYLEKRVVELEKQVDKLTAENDKLRTVMSRAA